ncbi:E3 ubiquitin-protein ligase TRIM56-like [Dendronephthya gigantea]|uniref:E3 ubiquitin-protein ligase TRIM56-like n=1 Tax=Dendronephthya gigantea TaxID=151771 RepID=UPI00106B7D6B|nr:E3 ubiquitin-protein ligase TRIM56-like [Dendronephthya gigantea]
MASAPDSAPAKQMEELLTCDICREILDEPKTLPCFHSFCKICLAKFIEVQREKTQRPLRRSLRAQYFYDCPKCRTQFELKSDSMEGIPPNFFINNLLKILPAIQQQTQKQAALVCGPCKAQESVTSRCIECEQYLCETCLTTHNKWPDFRNHVVMTLEDLEKPENQSKANGKLRCLKPGHGSKSFEFYCDICEELVCITCVLMNHPRPEHSY